MGCAASSSVAKHGSPVQAAFKRDPVCIDVEVPQPLVEEERHGKRAHVAGGLRTLPMTWRGVEGGEKGETLLTSKGKSSPVAEDKVQKDDRGADEEWFKRRTPFPVRQRAARSELRRFMIEGVDVRPYLPTVGAPCFHSPGPMFKFSVSENLHLPQRYCAYADPGQMQETVDVEQAFLSDPCRLMPQYTPESRCLGAGYASARAQAVSQDAGLGRSAAVQMPMKGKWINNVIGAVPGGSRGLRNHRSFVVMLFGPVLTSDQLGHAWPRWECRGLSSAELCEEDARLYSARVGCTVDAWLFMALLIQGIYVTPLQFFFLHGPQFFHLLYSLTLLYLDGPSTCRAVAECLRPIIRIHWGLICRNELNQEWKEDAFWAPGESHTPAKELGVEEYNALLDSDSLVYDASRNHFDQGVASSNIYPFDARLRSTGLSDLPPRTLRRQAKAMKRPASTAKLDPLQSYCDQVQEGLESSKVPPAVTRMLSGMVRSALLTSKDKRHKYQASVVQMVTDTIQGVGEDFEQAIADQKSKIANSETERAEREAAVKGAKEDFDAKKLLTQEKKYALAADAQAFKAAKEGVSKAQAAMREADKDLLDREKAKENLESIVTDLVTPLVQGAVTGDDARRSAGDVKELASPYNEVSS
ncbi:hypothetical protein AK812_SmicGene19197 [Symbiodinium microadriaticum]|uniref:Uncharacterized protein n=1 Tax=Symbiodinium microadriaticum TaxID=2951 RepID=A0A1Q9DT64_SYMMI|nr:hypothetical protein AK812_SmicGene19197 [Symbiodinium microadriaticum]